MLSPVTKNKTSSLEDFLSTKEACAIVPYTREYIGRLARERKVGAALLDGKWVVSASSLKDFFEQSKIEEEVLAERLSHERLTEQNASDFIFRSRISTSQFTTKQKFLIHAISVSTVMVVGFLFFFSGALFVNVSNVAQVFNFSESTALKNVSSLEAVEMTTSLDIKNGILLFPGQEQVTAVDPNLMFSDDVVVVDGEDGVKYFRVLSFENFSDIPFVNLSSGQQYYQEVESSEVQSATF